MKKFRQTIKGDLWIILLDIISVNAAYFLALMIRFFVGGRLFTPVKNLPGIYVGFAPFYTVFCLIVFFLFRLYGGMWRYAGVSDINRIIGATLVTTAFQVIGTIVYLKTIVPEEMFQAGKLLDRMPITFYAIGTALQFLFTCMIRFAYRFAVIERRKFNRNKANTMVVGAGDSGRYIIGLLDAGMAYRPACVIDDKFAGMLMDGLPVYGLDQMEEAADKHKITCVVIAETGERDQVKRLCDHLGLQFRDYSSYFGFTGESEEVAVVPAPQVTGKKGIPFSPPDISEAEISEVCEALRSGWITTGPRTKLLERRLAAYIETGRADIDTEADTELWKDRVVCLNSATAAEELNLRVLGIKEGDEVIVSAYTYTASASAVIHCGAKVVFVDIRKDGDERTHCPEMDYDKLEAAITEKTKAIIAVDLGGIVADYDRIFEIVERKRGLFRPVEDDGTPLGSLSSRIQKAIGRVIVISDAAHALGASRTVGGEKKYTGAIADFTSFSFHAVKNFTTAEGGASTWRKVEGVENSEIYRFFQLLSLHGQNKDALAKTKVGAWEYDIIGPWYKCNMTDIMAAIGLRQLDRYPGLLERRVEIIRKYDAVCDELGLEHLNHHVEGMDSSNHLYLVRIPGADVEKRNRVIEEMAKKGVATNVHYKPLPMMTAYKDAGIENFPNTFDYYRNLFTLPLHTLLTDDDVETVCGALRDVIRAC